MVKDQVVSLDNVQGHLFHPDEHIFEVKVFIGKIIVEVPLELIVGEFIGWLVLLVILAIFLDGIIS